MAEGAWAEYFWPGTEVLANKLGIRDPDELNDVEHRLTVGRQREIEMGAVTIPRTFDARHLAALHRHLFGDVYEWAGRWREVNMRKGGTEFAAVPWEVGAQLADAADVARSTDWSGVDRAGFVTGVARFYAHLNHAHPFREGNGRAGKLLVDQLAERSRFAIDWDAVSPQAWNDASAASHPEPFSGRSPDPTPLRVVFDVMAVDRDPPAGPGRPDLDGPDVGPSAADLIARTRGARRPGPAPSPRLQRRPPPLPEVPGREAGQGYEL